VNQEQSPRLKTRLVFFHPAFLCALALAICVGISHPILEMGLNDDWSYIWSARALAYTGHIHYNGWATAILGWQLYVGALFIKLFGFSFTIIRIPILMIGMVTVALLHRIFVRLGITERNATLATLTIALSPVFMPLAFSFMSDVPGFFCIVLCFYMCTRAIQADTDRAAVAWLILAASVNAIGGAVRQTAWLGILVVIPSATWYMRRRRGVLVAGAVSCIAGAFVIFACMRWFSLQPYSIVEKMVTAPTAPLAFSKRASGAVIRIILPCALFILPILAAFLWKYPLRLPRARKQGLIAAAVLISVTLFQIVRGKVFLPMALPFGNTIGPKGVMDLPSVFGDRPDVLTAPIRLFLNFVVLLSLAAFLICWSNTSSLKISAASARNRVPNTMVLYLLGPFTAAYSLLLITRVGMIDRYLLPLLVVALVVVVRFYQETFGGHLPLVSPLLIAAFALFGVAGMHDNFSMERARVSAAEELLKAGVPRSKIRAGFEFDAWTQLELAGYINDERLRVPAGAFHSWVPPNLPSSCLFFFAEHTPAFAGQYVLTYQPSSCFVPSQFPSVAYGTWLPPHRHQILIEKYSDLMAKGTP
jgi:Dolichyl-phosphate-mannose-protein mannosyltransferase